MSFLILLLALFTSCGNTTQNPESNETAATASPVVMENEDEELDDDQQNMIVGKLTKKDLQEGSYAGWFNRGYDNYKPSAEEIEIIKENIGDYEIVGFMGTWCPDSRREVPEFFKLLDEAGYDLSKLTMIGVDRSKTTPDNLEEGYNMSRVPTFIFLKDGEEVNRYVEYSQESLAEDVAAIVSGRDYKDSYSN
ncbi:thioredoxin family protein [Antarcticibacterium flavum]|uniref:Thioredoxin family protein n=1 Tax=Antarcticibacterium flavum TaxID=2058175 RepID=A0A5B7X4J7_9FLAO|nr:MULTISPECIES: thioredoxin family protein [Antarcticibacterium]MCM4160048.1 thiol reductase thioredoxin [Antarcticibacterium sp. W02-3]QCY70366.1 thioredoxin family protein [Antarcticibacterium flavum]